MKTSRERILDLLSRGVIDAAEAERLLASIAPGEREARGAALVNPFVRLGPLATIACGLVAVGLSLAWAKRGLRYDGFVDIHTSVPVGLGIALRDQLAAWPLAVVVFWLSSRYIARAPARLLDLVGAVGLARMPPAVLGPLALLIDPASPLGGARSLLALSALLLALALQLVWLFQGVRHAAGRTTSTSALAFVVACVIAEVLSKLVARVA